MSPVNEKRGITNRFFGVGAVGYLAVVVAFAAVAYSAGPGPLWNAALIAFSVASLAFAAIMVLSTVSRRERRTGGSRAAHSRVADVHDQTGMP